MNYKYLYIYIHLLKQSQQCIYFTVAINNDDNDCAKDFLTAAWKMLRLWWTNVWLERSMSLTRRELFIKIIASTPILSHFEPFPLSLFPHPMNGNEDLPVAVDHQKKRQQQTKDKEADDVRSCFRGVLVPLDWTGGAGTLRTVAAPAEEWWHCPQERVQPAACDEEPGLPIVRHICFWTAENGAVTLVWQYSKGYQWNNTCWYRIKRQINYMLINYCNSKLLSLIM